MDTSFSLAFNKRFPSETSLFGSANDETKTISEALRIAFKMLVTFYFRDHINRIICMFEQEKALLQDNLCK